MKKVIITFGLIASLLLALLQLSKYSLMMNSFNSEFVVVGFALLFLGFGYWVSRYLVKKKSGLQALPEATEELNTEKIKELGISKREYEVLQKIEEGLSNHEIAQTLFISESTVKTHVSNLLLKLDARRRTQAVTIAKELRIL